jgi:glutamyl-tRNA synthetase
MGYLPEAMRNYLLRLGWSHGDNEIIPTEKAIDWFDLDGIGRSAARFDLKKLDSINGQYIREMSDGALADETITFAERRMPGRSFDASARARLTLMMPLLKTRAKTLVELLDKSEFLFTSGAPPLEAAASAVLKPETRKRLGGLARVLEFSAWDLPSLEATTRAFAEKEGIALGDIAQPLRAVLTGRTASPPVFDILAVLGREEALTRIRAQGE